MRLDKNIVELSFEFEKLIQRINTTGELDLTNRTINEQELPILFFAIEQNEINDAFLLGVKPNHYQQELFKKLQEKSRLQKTPIQIHYTQKLDDVLTSQFDRQFRQQAHDNYKASMRFEPSRLGSAISKGPTAFLSQVMKEIKGEVAQFGGEDNETKVTLVKKLNNPGIQKKFEDIREKKLTRPLPESLASSMQTIQTTDIDLAAGEMLLYHGTSSETSPLIMRYGFDEGRCRFVTGNGYGPLGKGIYFTPELSKAATFARCSQCDKTEQCFCYDEKTMTAAERVVLLSRVYVGNPVILLAKNPAIKDQENPPEGFNSYVALSKDIDGLSAFRSTEICVPKGIQAIPLYEIRFTFSPNYLLLDKWDEAIRRTNLNSTSEIQGLFHNHYVKLKELIQLRADNDNSDEIEKKAGEVHYWGNEIIKSLSDKKNQLTTQDNLTTEQAENIKLISEQCMIFINLQTQLKNILTKNECKSANRPSEKKTNIQNSYLSGPSFFNRLLPKQYALKQDLSKLHSTLNNNEDPKELMKKLIDSLSIAIARDQTKSSSLPFFSSNPSHRILLTQTMIRLKGQLEPIEHTTPQQAYHLLSSAINSLRKDADKYKEIKTATAFIMMKEFQQTLESMDLEDLSYVNNEKEKISY